jgi:hypothetical protein
MNDAHVCFNMKNGNVETIAFGHYSLLSVETTADKTTMRSMMGDRMQADCSVQRGIHLLSQPQGVQ